MAEIVTCVAACALSALRVASAVRILLLCNDAVDAVDHVAWVAGEAGPVGVVSVTKGVNWHAGAG